VSLPTFPLVHLSPNNVQAAPVATTNAVSTPSSGPVASIEDVPIKAIDILLVIVAQKLKKRVDEIPLSKSIKDLVSGKSTLQNEILNKSSPRLLKRVKNFL
jgi:fatty acid synthase subunit alpha, fungi type